MRSFVRKVKDDPSDWLSQICAYDVQVITRFHLQFGMIFSKTSYVFTQRFKWIYDPSKNALVLFD